MKKLLFLLVVVLTMMVSVTPIFACGSQHCNTRAVQYSVCTVKSCTLTGLHTHNKKSYTAHYYGDGHAYHAYCEQEDCIVTGYHVHDNVYCFGHIASDGHDYHDYCAIKNCSITGYHEHEGSYCFGHSLNDGHSYHHAGGHH